MLFTPKEILKNITEYRREAKAIKRIRPDVVIARLDAYKISTALLCRRHHIPFVLEADGAMSFEWLEFHNQERKLNRFCLMAFERYNFHLAQKIFVQSNVTRDYYIQLLGRQEKIAVITNAADVRAVTVPATRLRQDLGIPQTSVVCGFMGSFHYWHDAAALRRITENLLLNHAELCFLFIGQGGVSADSIRKEFSQRPWSHRAVFIDHVPHDQIQNYINIFDIALAPYMRQRLFYYSPVKIFEYMAYGKAVVTAPFGQVEELIQDRENGLFYNPDQEGDLETKVTELVLKPDLRFRLGAKAKELIAGAHTWSHKAKQLETLCWEVCRNANQTKP